MKKILLGMVMTALIGLALAHNPAPAAATCSFTGVLTPNCAGPGNTCVQVWFGHSGTAVIDLQRKIAGVYATVATNISSGDIYCPAAVGLGPVEYRLKMTCSYNGVVTYFDLGAVTCP